jgi:hypothetical protein
MRSSRSPLAEDPASAEDPEYVTTTEEERDDDADSEAAVTATSFPHAVKRVTQTTPLRQM